jgi:hypothetical protein
LWCVERKEQCANAEGFAKGVPNAIAVFGFNAFGQLGDGSGAGTSRALIPERVPLSAMLPPPMRAFLREKTPMPIVVSQMKSHHAILPPQHRSTAHSKPFFLTKWKQHTHPLQP